MVDGYTTVDVMTAYTLLTGTEAGQYCVVDVRSPQEYATAHIAQSMNIPLNTLAEASLPKDRTIVVACVSGNRSGVACDFLHQQGYHCANLAGGISAWIAHGLPVARGSIAV